MRERTRANAIVVAILLLLSPIVYVGGEGAFYLTTDEFWFPPDSAYRRIYSPLDAASERVPGLYGIRQDIAEVWLRLGGESDRSVTVHPADPFNGY